MVSGLGTNRCLGIDSSRRIAGNSSELGSGVRATGRLHETSKISTCLHHMGVSENRGTPKSSILIGFSIINHPFWGTPIFGNIHIDP